MRNWSIPAGRMFGIELRVHLSFFLLPFFIWYTEYQAHGAANTGRDMALFALIFPTRVRSTALGLGGAAGQIGKIGSPMLVGAVLANGWKPDTILFAVALLPAIGVLLMLLVRLSRRYAVASVSQSA